MTSQYGSPAALSQAIHNLDPGTRITMRGKTYACTGVVDIEPNSPTTTRRVLFRRTDPVSLLDIDMFLLVADERVTMVHEATWMCGSIRPNHNYFGQPMSVNYGDVVFKPIRREGPWHYLALSGNQGTILRVVFGGSTPLVLEQTDREPWRALRVRGVIDPRTVRIL